MQTSELMLGSTFRLGWAHAAMRTNMTPTQSSQDKACNLKTTIKKPKREAISPKSPGSLLHEATSYKTVWTRLG